MRLDNQLEYDVLASFLQSMWKLALDETDYYQYAVGNDSGIHLSAEKPHRYTFIHQKVWADE